MDNTISSNNNRDKAIVIAVAIIEKNGKLLMVQEAEEEIRGLWNVPAGHIDSGETPTDAVVREAKEETGFDVEPVSLAQIQCYKHKNGRTSLRFNFYCKIIGGEIKNADSEIQDVKWLSKEELEELKKEKKLRSRKTWWSIEAWFSRKEFPLAVLKSFEGDFK